MKTLRRTVAVLLSGLLLVSAGADAEAKRKRKKRKPAPVEEKAEASAPEETPEPAESEDEAVDSEGDTADAPVDATQGDAAAPSAEDDRNEGYTAELSWPQSIFLRPLTLPQGVIAAGIDIETFKLAGVRAEVLARYGILDDLQVGAFYDFSLRDFNIKGGAGLELVYRVFAGGALPRIAPGGPSRPQTEILLRARGGFDVDESELLPVRAGLFARHRLDRKLGFFAAAYFEGTLIESSSNLQPMRVLASAGAAYQIDAAIYAEARLELAQINILDTTSSYLFVDRTPLTLQGFYTLENFLDLGAGAYLNLNDAGNDWGFLLSARYYAGQN